MNQTEKARRFAELHVKGAPLLLFNANRFSLRARKRSRQAAGPSRRRRVTETARPFQSSSLSRSSRGSRRPSMSL